MYTKRLTPEQITFIQNNYGKLSPVQIARKCGIYYGDIPHIVRELGLKGA